MEETPTDAPRVLPVLLLPGGVSAVAIVASALLGHVLIGIAAGLALGLVGSFLQIRKYRNS